MDSLPVDLLKDLGSGQPIGSLCRANGIARAEFDRLWTAEIRRRTPDPDLRLQSEVSAEARIVRNRWGVPQIQAQNDEDLFFAFGFAMAQDRLFQLDYLRRRGCGRLSEILGREGIQLDTIARTVGLNRIAASEWDAAPAETRALLQRFSDGVNASIDHSGGNLPIEFALLDYLPEPWRPVDCLAIASEFRYYLTVRFPVIVGPELTKRALGDGTLYAAFLTGEADEESIVPAGAYPAAAGELSRVGAAVGDPQEGEGQQQLGRERRPHAVGTAHGGKRPPHRIRRSLLLVRSAVERWLV